MKKLAVTDPNWQNFRREKGCTRQDKHLQKQGRTLQGLILWQVNPCSPLGCGLQFVGFLAGVPAITPLLQLENTQEH